MEVTPSQFHLMRQLMANAQVRHQVLSHNLANVNTPGFHRFDVEFEEQLGALLRSGDDTARLKPRITQIHDLPERIDGNNVDVDREMGQLNKNALLYQTWSQIMASKVSAMRSAIKGS